MSCYINLWDGRKSEQKQNMCTTCSGSKESEMVNVRVVYDQTSGHLSKLVISANQVFQGTQFVANGYEVGSSLEVDADGNKYLPVTLKVVSSSGLGYYDLDKSINHIVEISASDMQTMLGSDPKDFSIKLKTTIDGVPVVNHTNVGCVVKCKAVWWPNLGVWIITCTIVCPGKETILTDVIL